MERKETICTSSTGDRKQWDPQEEGGIPIVFAGGVSEIVWTLQEEGSVLCSAGYLGWDPGSN